MASRILLIGTERWAATLRRNYELSHAASGKRARADTGRQLDLVIVDAASMYISGERICRDMRARFPDASMLLISDSAQAEADLILSADLTSRRLMGAVKRLLSADRQAIIRCGPFVLNRISRILFAHGRHVPLNPKLAALIELFLSHPNETLPRASIMQEVWQTHYLGDTRTLNVHIRRARKLLEKDPQQPVYLKTVRGQGYRLEIDSQSKSGPTAPASNERDMS